MKKERLIDELSKGRFKMDEYAFREIRLILRKLGVTEKWIEEKAKDLHHELYGEQDDEDYVHGSAFFDIKNFIRSLVEEIQGKYRVA